MSVNGSVGRARRLSSWRRRAIDRAEAAGVDTSDVVAVREFSDAWFLAFFAGLSERAKCGCAGGIKRYPLEGN